MKRQLTTKQAHLEFYDPMSDELKHELTVKLDGLNESNLRTPIICKKNDQDYICFPQLEHFQCKKQTTDRSLSLHETLLREIDYESKLKLLDKK